MKKFRQFECMVKKRVEFCETDTQRHKCIYILVISVGEPSRPVQTLQVKRLQGFAESKLQENLILNEFFEEQIK
jgi:hypothetical protein